MAFKILKGGLELKHILNILQCVHYNKHYNWVKKSYEKFHKQDLSIIMYPITIEI